MCGPTAQENELAGQEASFSQMLQSNYATDFGEQQNILGNLTNILTPIAEAGPNQQGFSAAELAAENTGAIDTTGANYANAARAIGGETAGRGVAGAPESGVDEQIKEGLASSEAGALSNEELGITEANYATGRANFNNAVSGLGGVSSQYNPNATAGEATGANKAGFGEASEIEQQQAQEDEDIVGGITSLGLSAVGGAAGAMGGAAGAMGGGGMQGFLEGLSG